jgi:uncharacterized membrane protein YgaE (UPF0421/DUF939 family)
VDPFLNFDPGLNRFRAALQVAVTLAAAIVGGWLFVHFTHALHIEAPHGASLTAAAAAKLAAVNHLVAVNGVAFSGAFGLILSLSARENTVAGRLRTTAAESVAIVAGLTVGIAIGGHRLAALASLVLALALAVYCQRFGARGFFAGLALFLGDLVGFLLHGRVSMGDLGWLAAELGVGAVAATAVGLLLFPPRPVKDLVRTQRSFGARARKVARLAAELFDDPHHSDRDLRRLRWQLVRLNETALLIDAQLGDPRAVPERSSALRLHQHLFDMELALTNIARFASVLTGIDLLPGQLDQIRQVLDALAAGDRRLARTRAAELGNLPGEARAVSATRGQAVVVAHRLADSVIDLVDGSEKWTTSGRVEQGEASFRPAVTLVGGGLPGSAVVSAITSQQPGARWWDGPRLAPYARSAIQIAVAAAAAIAAGDALSGTHYFWALLGVLMIFMGANNSGERALKALFRVIGTAVGIAVGSGLAHAVGGHSNWSIAVIVAAMFFAIYLMEVNSVFLFIGITVALSQLYVDLHEFSDSFLLLRLGENAVGAAISAVVVLVVLPVRPRRVFDTALRGYLQALNCLVGDATTLLGGDYDRVQTLHTDARAVDASYQSLVATAPPLRRAVFGSLDAHSSEILRLATAARDDSRNLVGDVQTARPLDPLLRKELQAAGATLGRSLEVLANAVGAPHNAIYVPSAATFDRAENYAEENPALTAGPLPAIRDLRLVDGTMAQLAQTVGLQLADDDTDVGLGVRTTTRI